MRPLYESSSDLEAERAFMASVSSVKNVTFLKLPIHYKVDALMLRHNFPFAWTELKCRAINFNQYPTIIISLKKVKSGIKLRECLWGMGKTLLGAKKMKFLFLVRLLDGDYYHEVTTLSDYEVKEGGRTAQTRDAFDVEQVVHIPTERFRRIERTEASNSVR